MTMEMLKSILAAGSIGAAIWVLHGPSAVLPAVLLGILCAILAEVLFHC